MTDTFDPLRPADPRPRARAGRSFRIATLVPMAVVAACGLPMCANCSASCMGYDDVALEAVAACPEAVALLGENPRFGWVGIACGSAETGGGRGYAGWRMPIQGDKTGGVYRFSTEQSGGRWRMTAGEIEVGDRVVDLAHCAPRVELSALHLTGVVAQASGAAPVGPGARCAFTAEPSEGGGTNCRLSLTCGDQILHGGPSRGYTVCHRDGEALVAQDVGMSPQDQDPALDLHTGRGRVVVSDMGPQGLFSVEVTLSGP